MFTGRLLVVVPKNRDVLLIFLLLKFNGDLCISVFEKMNNIINHPYDST